MQRHHKSIAFVCRNVFCSAEWRPVRVAILQTSQQLEPVTYRGKDWDLSARQERSIERQTFINPQRDSALRSTEMPPFWAYWMQEDPENCGLQFATLISGIQNLAPHRFCWFSCGIASIFPGRSLQLLHKHSSQLTGAMQSCDVAMKEGVSSSRKLDGPRARPLFEHHANTLVQTTIINKALILISLHLATNNYKWQINNYKHGRECKDDAGDYGR